MEKLDQNPIQYVIKHVIMADAGVLDSTEKNEKNRDSKRTPYMEE